MYEIQITNSVKRDISNLSKKVQKEINTIFLELSNNPFLGESLKGEFSEYFSIHFKISKVEYRIIYKTYKKELVVLVVLIGSRENIYKQLKRRI
jgi:addiction module RelE/StbE family toxin